MLKKIILGILLLPSLLQAWNCDCQDFRGAFRVARFYPDSNLVRKIYKNRFVDYQLEFTAPISQCWCSDLYGWLNVSYMNQRGCSIGLHNKTWMTVVPTTIGVKKYFSGCGCECLFPYVGAGIGATWARFHDESRFVKEHRYGVGFAGLLKVGAEYFVSENFYVEGFADYLFSWVHYGRSKPGNSHHSANLSGVKVGVGIGYKI